MGGLGFAHPWVLLLLVLAVLPLWDPGTAGIRYPWLARLPRDRASRWLGFALRLIAVLAFTALVGGLAGLYQAGGRISQVQKGAQLVIVLDRSKSMNNSFAGRAPQGGQQTKARAASRLLLDFVQRRPDNVYGLVEFSTSPIYALPLTTKPEAIQAALRAAANSGLALTDVASPLAMAVSYFDQRQYAGARVVLLVSDGAAVIDPETQETLQDWFLANDVRLYWIYIRTRGSPGIFPTDDAAAGDQQPPEQLLHEYFKSLGIPYRAYQADDPAALRRAVADMDTLERLPLVTSKVLPRRELAPVCYAAALLMLLLLLIANLLEVRVWAAR